MGKASKKDTMKNASERQGYFEDTECFDCLYYKGQKRGCSLTACSCEDIRNDSKAKNKVKRKRGSA